jgi:hypothetical protein
MQRRYFIPLLVFTILAMSVFQLGTFSHNGQKMSTMVQNQPLQDQAQQAIDAAQSAINAAYSNLVFADSVGSSINDLIGSLNGAILDLNAARHAYNLTDYSTAITLAENAESAANTVSSEAQQRGVITTAQTQSQIIVTIAIVSIVLVGSYFAVTRWQKYRKQKRREFLQMEIRLTDDDDEEDAT